MPSHVPTGKPKSDDPEHLAKLATARERRAQGLPVYEKKGRPKGMTKAEKKQRYKEILATAKANYVPVCSGNPTGRRPKSDDPKHLAKLAAARERRAQGLPVYEKIGRPKGKRAVEKK